jgi:hypothetical protein
MNKTPNEPGNEHPKYIMTVKMADVKNARNASSINLLRKYTIGVYIPSANSVKRGSVRGNHASNTNGKGH